MAGEYTGRGTALGFGKETTWGTLVARSNWLRALSCSIQERHARAPIPELYQAGGADYMHHFSERVDCGGDLELPLTYEGIGFLLENLMGAACSTSGAGPYTHTFNRGVATGASATGLSLELVRGSSGTSEIFEGCSISTASLLFSAGSISRLRLGILAEKANAARNTAGTVTLSSDTLVNRSVFFQHVPSFSFNSVTYYPESLEVMVDNKLTPVFELGSLYATGLVRSGHGEIKIKSTVKYRSNTLYTAHQAGTQANVTVSIVGGSPNALSITGRNAVIHSLSDPISSAGIITQDVEFWCYADASNGALTLAIDNDQATFSSN